MAYLQNIDFILEVAKGNILGHSIVQLTGRNSHTGTEFEDIGDLGSIYTLDYDAQTANFTVGTLLTGGTSGATGQIVADVDNGATGTLYLRDIQVANFQDNEIITDAVTGSATVNEPVTGQENKIKARTEPTAGVQFEVVCESANDTSAGTGARTIVVEFMEEATRTYTSEIISLNGHTPVTFTSTDGYRVRRAQVLTFGAQTPHPVVGKTNLGVIIIRDSASKDIQGVISMDDEDANDTFGINNTFSLYYTVPADHTAFPTFITVNTAKGNDILARSVVTADGGEGILTAGEIGVYQNSFVEDLTVGEQGVPEKTDIKIIGKSDSVDTLVNVQAILVLIENSYLNGA